MLAAVARACRVQPVARTLVPVARPATSAALQKRSIHKSVVPENAITGKTGQAVLGLGLAAAAISKEILLFNNETIVCISVAGVTYLLITRVGGSVAEMLDDRAKSIHDSLSVSREARIEGLKRQIEEQENVKTMLADVDQIFDVNEELNSISRELAYRTELHDARNAAVKQLEDMARLEAQERLAEQTELVQKLEKEVLESLKSEEAAILAKCISDLEGLSAKA